MLRTRGNILVVDGNVNSQTATLRAVRSLGYDGRIAPSAEQAVLALHQETFDLVLMDCRLPGQHGCNGCVALHRSEAESGGHIPIVAIAAGTPGHDHARCLHAGLDDYLAKPFRTAWLDAALRRWIRRRPTAA